MNMKQNIVQSQRYSNENLRNMEICGQLVMNTLPQGVHLNSRMRKKHKSLTLWASIIYTALFKGVLVEFHDKYYQIARSNSY